VFEVETAIDKLPGVEVNVKTEESIAELSAVLTAE
jgi:hypothetical protein